jgi:crotonobetainyl-CoA:carnitine CoA-transferase CaiB-like acyl-CoA transferase
MLADATGHPEWKNDERFSSNAARVRNWRELMRMVEQWTSMRPAKDCEAFFMAAGIPAAAYRTVREAMEDPYFSHRGSFVKVKDGGGAFLVPNLPFKMSRTRVQAGSHVAGMGADTELVLKELLGMDAEQAKSLSQPYEREGRSE